MLSNPCIASVAADLVSVALLFRRGAPLFAWILRLARYRIQKASLDFHREINTLFCKFDGNDNDKDVYAHGVELFVLHGNDSIET